MTSFESGPEQPVNPEGLQKLYKRDLLLLAARVIDLRHRETQNHSVRVETWAVFLAKHIPLTDKETDTLIEACLLHDIGKIAFPDELFLTPQPNAEQLSIIKQHPIKSEETMLNLASISNETRDIIRHHHERINGTGYPNGLKGDKIKYMVKIIAVLDAFDAMISPRSYRKGRGEPEYYSIQEAIARLREDVSAGKLDTEIVEALKVALFV